MDYRVEIDDESIHRRLGYLLRATNDLTPLMGSIAGMLSDGAKRAFEDERAPDGSGWAKVSAVTIALSEKSGHTPISILQRSGHLARSISSQVTPTSVSVGTNVIYAAVQQFGAAKRQFKGVAPWRRIPARPFLGLSDDARDEIRELAVQHILATFGRA